MHNGDLSRQSVQQCHMFHLKIDHEQNHSLIYTAKQNEKEGNKSKGEELKRKE